MEYLYLIVVLIYPKSSSHGFGSYYHEYWDLETDYKILYILPWVQVYLIRCWILFQWYLFWIFCPMNRVVIITTLSFQSRRNFILEKIQDQIYIIHFISSSLGIFEDSCEYLIINKFNTKTCRTYLTTLSDLTKLQGTLTVICPKWTIFGEICLNNT